MSLKNLENHLSRHFRGRYQALAKGCAQLVGNPLRGLLVVTGAGLFFISLLAFVKSPGIQFALTINAAGFEARIAANDGYAPMGGILAQGLAWETEDMGVDAHGDNILVLSGEGGRLQDSIQAAAGSMVELDTLLVPDLSVLRLRMLADHHRTPYLDLEVSEIPEGTGVGAVVIFGQGPGSEGSRRKELVSLKYRLYQPELETDAIPPFQIAGLRLTSQVPVRDVMYPVSLIDSGALEFFSMKRSLGAKTLDAGDMLFFEGLIAEVNALSIQDGAVRLRLFGTAHDVKWGAGSAISSVYPSALDGLGAHPVVRFVLGAVSGIMLALLGAVAGRRAHRPELPD